MNTLKFLATFTIMVGCLSQIAGAESFFFSSNLSIPDSQSAGVSDVETIASGISQIGSVQVALNITGDFNGDLYCYLVHGSSLSVLLNRPGRMVNNPFGYADSGFNITLIDQAANGNIHNYEGMLTPADGSPLTGIWQPDGRTSSPASVLDTDPSTAGLSVFNSLNASGDWTLFLADLSPGGNSTLNSWQLIINPVPEPSSLALVCVGLGAMVALRRGRKSK
jgi:subtilisin-like proprotein convertase family protein